MRRIISIVGILMLGTVGCKFVGGKCDCGPKPGEAGIYAPYALPSGPIKVETPAKVETGPAAKELKK